MKALQQLFKGKEGQAQSQMKKLEVLGKMILLEKDGMRGKLDLEFHKQLNSTLLQNVYQNLVQLKHQMHNQNKVLTQRNLEIIKLKEELRGNQAGTLTKNYLNPQPISILSRNSNYERAQEFLRAKVMRL